MNWGSGDTDFPSPPFRRYWSAVAVSGFGDYVTLLSLQALVVLTLNGSATQVGLVSSARWLPYLVIGVVIGALVDRRRRLPLLVGTDLAQAVVLVAIPVLWLLDVLTFPVLLAITFVYGLSGVVNAAAAMSFLPRMVRPEHLQRAHARVDGTDAAASTAGPALGGALVSLLGAPFAVLVDAATYLFSAVQMARIDVSEPPPLPRVSLRQLFRDVGEGFEWVYHGSGLTALALSTHGWFVAHAAVTVVLAPFVLDGLDLSPFVFGIIGAVGGLGALLGAAVTTRVGLALGTGRTIIACDGLAAVATAVLALAAGVVPVAVVVAILCLGQGIYGLSMGVTNSHEMSYRQLITPDRLQARTNLTMRSMNRAVVVFVAPLAGLVADAAGYRATLLGAAAVFTVVTVGLWLTPFRHARAPMPAPLA